MPSLANDSCRKGEGTLHRKPEAGILHCRAPSPEDVTKENAGTIQAAGEVEEEAPRRLLHQQKGRGPALPSLHQFSLAN